MSEPVFFYYDPRPACEQDAEIAAMWEHVKEGADIVDAEGNVIGKVGPAREVEPGRWLAHGIPLDDT